MVCVATAAFFPGVCLCFRIEVGEVVVSKLFGEIRGPEDVLEAAGRAARAGGGRRQRLKRELKMMN
jgi:hypothetical protein